MQEVVGSIPIGSTIFLQIIWGPVAQLGERIVRNDEVVSSILIGSTILNPAHSEEPLHPYNIILPAWNRL